MNRRTYYIYKGYDQTKTLAIIAPNVASDRYLQEVRHLNAKHGHITIRNCLGGLVSEMTEGGKINSFLEGKE